MTMDGVETSKRMRGIALTPILICNRRTSIPWPTKLLLILVATESRRTGAIMKAIAKALLGKIRTKMGKKYDAKAGNAISMYSVENVEYSFVARRTSPLANPTIIMIPNQPDTNVAAGSTE